LTDPIPPSFLFRKLSPYRHLGFDLFDRDRGRLPIIPTPVFSDTFFPDLHPPRVGTPLYPPAEKKSAVCAFSAWPITVFLAIVCLFVLLANIITAPCFFAPFSASSGRPTAPGYDPSLSFPPLCSRFRFGRLLFMWVAASGSPVFDGELPFGGRPVFP